MNYYWLAVVVLLTGCITDHDYNIIHGDVMYVGDSLCYKVFDVEEPNRFEIWDDYQFDKMEHATAQNLVGIRTNCIPGRRVTQVEQLPDGYRVLFLALGTNDISRTPLDEFRLHYQTLVYTVDVGTLYCVLPDGAELYRQVIREICVNVIDPLEHGVKFRAKDGVHMNDLDHKLWVRPLRDRVIL